MFNPIEARKRLVQGRIEKSFQNNVGEQREQSNEVVEKAYQVGDEKQFNGRNYYVHALNSKGQPMWRLKRDGAKKDEEGGGEKKAAKPEEKKSVSDHASEASDEALKRAAADEKAKPEVREAAKKELEKRGAGKDEEKKTDEHNEDSKKKEIQKKNSESLNRDKIEKIRNDLSKLFGNGDDNGYKKAADRYNQLKDEYGKTTAYLSIATGPGVPLKFVNYVKAIEQSGASHEVARDYSREIGQKAFSASEFEYDMREKKYEEGVAAIKPFVDKIKVAQGMPDGKINGLYVIGRSQNKNGDFYMPTKDEKGKWKDGWKSAEEIEKMANDIQDGGSDSDFTDEDDKRFNELDGELTTDLLSTNRDEYYKKLDEFRKLKQKKYNQRLKDSGALNLNDFKDVAGISDIWLGEAVDSNGKMITPYIRINLERKSDVNKFIKDVKKKFGVELSSDDFEYSPRNRYSDSFYEVCINPETGKFADDWKTNAAIKESAQKKQAEINERKRNEKKKQATAAIKESITKDSIENFLDDDDVRSHAFSYFNYGDDDECSDEEKEQFKKLKKIGAKMSSYFDWTEDEEAEKYERKMQSKGYRLFDISTGDGYMWLLIKNNKLDKGGEIKKSLESVSDLIEEIRNNR